MSRQWYGRMYDPNIAFQETKPTEEVNSLHKTENKIKKEFHLPLLSKVKSQERLKG